MIRLKTCTFVHVPRTGGAWVASALQAAGVEILGIEGDQHEPVEGPVFYFVRHPVDWMMSYWMYRQNNDWNWQQGIELDETCMDKDFIQFMWGISDRNGLLIRHLNHFVAAYSGNEQHVGRTESLAKDLVRILEHFDVPHNRNKILSHPPVCVSSQPKPKLLDIRKVFDPSQADYFQKFGYELHYG